MQVAKVGGIACWKRLYGALLSEFRPDLNARPGLLHRGLCRGADGCDVVAIGIHTAALEDG